MDGVLVVDKPVGPTSHDVVARARRALGESRIGHTGTLDPGASGVLPLVIGRATRLARFLSGADKHYQVLVRLGWSTETGDAQGAPVGERYEGDLPSQDSIEAVLETFRGTFLQQPPAYSAKRVDGKRSYKLARAKARALMEGARTGHQALGTEQQHPAPGTRHPAPVPVTVTALTLVTMDQRSVTLDVSCSAGFYVRALARDLGERLGTGGHVAALRRVGSGEYRLADAITLDLLDRNHEAAAEAVIPLSQLLRDLAAVVLTANGMTRAKNGCELRPGDLMPGPEGPGLHLDAEAPDWIRMLDPAGQLIGLARSARGSGLLHPSVVLM